MEVDAGLDENGQVTAWDYRLWSPSHVNRPRMGGQLLAVQLTTGEAAQPSPFGFAPGRFVFGAERNARTNYAFLHQRVTVHYLADSPLRTWPSAAWAGRRTPLPTVRLSTNWQLPPRWMPSIPSALLNDARAQTVIREPPPGPGGKRMPRQT